MIWRKSSRCESGDCVEVTYTADAVLMRNSTDPQTVLSLPPASWWAFMADLECGRFDHRI